MVRERGQTSVWAVRGIETRVTKLRGVEGKGYGSEG